MPYQIQFSQFNVFPTTRRLRPGPMKMPLFSNNAAVYYKPHSLAAGGVGTVRNSSIRGRRI